MTNVKRLMQPKRNERRDGAIDSRKVLLEPLGLLDREEGRVRAHVHVDLGADHDEVNQAGLPARERAVAARRRARGRGHAAAKPHAVLVEVIRVLVLRGEGEVRAER